MRRAGVLVTVCLLLMSGIVLVFPRPAKGGNVSPPFVETTLTAALGQAISLDVLPDGSGRFLIVEKDGWFRSWNGTAVSTIDQMTGISTGGEQGLLGVVVDPAWPARPYVYVHYTTSGAPSYVQVGRWNLTDSGGVLAIDPASLLVLLDDMPNANTNHNGGTLRFGPDGRLYASIGDDAQSSGCLAQDLTVLAGKILRINIDDTMNPANRATLAPSDNPFILNPSDNAKLVWAYGLRNPFRMDIDPVTGAVYIGDVGASTREEVSLVTVAGQNLGWPYWEGFFQDPTPPACPGGAPLSPWPPIYDYPHGVTASVMGTTVYRGVNYPFDASFPPEYEGNLFLIEFFQNFMRVLRWNATSSAYDLVPGVTAMDWGDAYDGTADMIRGPDGALYMVSLYDGTLRRIAYPPSAVNQPPMAVFTVAPPTAVNPGVAFTFNGSASSDADGFVASWDWDLGDGNASSGVEVTHAYAASGDYTVTLTVTDNASSTDTASTTVHVNFPPAASFTYAPPAGINPGMPVSFDGSGSSDPDGTVDNHTWDFGDGNGDFGAAVSHPYLAGGIYTVTLTVADNGTLTDTATATVFVNTPPLADFTATPTAVNPGDPVAFDASPSLDPDGTVDNYSWDFGDGGVGWAPALAHGYAAPGWYVATLTVTDNNSLTDSASRGIYVNSPPTAVLNASPQPANPGVPLLFDAGGSTDDGTIATYAWEFGDGATGAGITANHAYALPGTYQANLTVVDNMTLADTVTRAVIILDTTPNLLPIANLSYAPPSPRIATVVTFDGSTSSDPDGVLTDFAFDFGDGNVTNGTASVVTHAFAIAGPYTATLTVTDDSGANSTATVVVTVRALNSPPTAVAAVWPGTPGSLFTTFQFDALNSTDGGIIVNHSWDFGDGSNATGPVVTHAFATKGNHTVTLTVTDDENATGTAAVNVTVLNLSPTAVPSVLPTTGNLSTVFALNGSSSMDPDGNITAYAWDFGDGNTATGAAATHSYARGNFTATLTVTDDDGATATAAVSILVANRPPDVSTTPDAAAVLVVAGQSQEFEAATADADGDEVTITWTVDGVEAGNGSRFAFRPQVAGTYEVAVTVFDGFSNVTRTWTVAVSSPPPAVFGFNAFFVAVLVLVVLFLFVLLLATRRRKRPQEEMPPAPPQATIVPERGGEANLESSEPPEPKS